MKQYRFLTFLTMLLLAWVSCSDDLEPAVATDSMIHEGEAVEFTVLVPDVPATRVSKTDWENELKAYHPMPRDYKLNIEMYKYKGDDEEPEKLGSADYERLDNALDQDDPGYATQQYDGTLKPMGDQKLRWLDNVNRWGFKATAGSETLSAQQRDKNEWLAQDRLVGYSYLPIWDTDKATNDDNYFGEDSFNAINFRTPKQWYEDNKKAKELSGLMVQEGSNGSEYKKIPLYMQHQRAWVTVILRADEGVKREALYFNTSKDNIKAKIHSYGADPSETVVIEDPWSREELIDYEEEKTGGYAAQNNVSTTRYDAIVEPYDYGGNTEAPQPIIDIELANQKFKYYATNDLRFVQYGNDPSSDQYKEWQSIYDLKAGQHLTIEATLSRASLKILITAWVEDWTEAVTTTICDDYGQNGDPIIINNRQELIDFLKGSDNVAGTVAIIQPTSMDLGTDWTASAYTLNATLNMAGATFTTSTPFVDEISSSGSIINGTIEVQEGVTVPTAICDENHGTLERMKVTKAKGALNAKATQAGLVNINYGTIYLCTSDLNVYAPSAGTADAPVYVGGIAAQSIYSTNGVMPTIDACTVNANVNGVSGVKGGGMAGLAAGRITNCTFEYGITLTQNSNNFKNIFSLQNEGQTLRAYNNGWPTSALNYVINDAAQAQTYNQNIYADTYDAVINSETELRTLLKSEYNVEGKKYRISDNFTVSSATWIDEQGNPLGKVDDQDKTVSTPELTKGNVFFQLYGNNKTITLTGNKEVSYSTGNKPGEGTTTTVTTAPMLFSNVMDEIHDLKLYLDKPVVSAPSVSTTNGTDSYSGVDAIAPLAYAVTGDAVISNVRVTASADAYVQSATPGGLVVWAYGTNDHHPTIENCVVDADVRMWLPYTWTYKDAKQYAGGIVCMASVAEIKQCQYLRADGLAAAVTDEAYQTATDNTDVYPANGTMCFYGGIVGGTTYNAQRSDPAFAKLAINECSSWYTVTTQCSRGSIIGYVLYSSGSGDHTLTNAMAEGNHGNWWPDGSYAISSFDGNPTEDKAVGKRNSMTPDRK